MFNPVFIPAFSPFFPSYSVLVFASLNILLLIYLSCTLCKICFNSHISISKTFRSFQRIILLYNNNFSFSYSLFFNYLVWSTLAYPFHSAVYALLPELCFLLTLSLFVFQLHPLFFSSTFFILLLNALSMFLFLLLFSFSLTECLFVFLSGLLANS